MEEQIAPDMVFVALTHEQVFCFSLSDIIHQCHIREMEESTETGLSHSQWTVRQATGHKT